MTERVRENSWAPSVFPAAILLVQVGLSLVLTLYWRTLQGTSVSYIGGSSWISFCGYEKGIDDPHATVVATMLELLEAQIRPRSSTM